MGAARPTPTPRSIRAYVRIDALLLHSAMNPDLTRLKTAEAKLRALANRASALGGGPIEPYAISPLRAVQPGLSAEQVKLGAAREELVLEASERLRQTAGNALSRYSQSREDRQQELISQRREELKAVYQGRDIAAERAARDSVYARAVDSARPIADQVAAVSARIAVLSAQLGYRDPVTDEFKQGTFPPIVNAEAFERDVATAEKDPKATGISVQARMVATRRLENDQLAALEEQLKTLEATATAQATNAAAEVARKQLSEIERELNDLDRTLDLQGRLRAQQRALENVLAEQAAAASRVSHSQDVQKGALAGIDGGAVQLSDLFGAYVAKQDSAGAEAAANRVQDQRQRLERYIREDVIASVRDAARARNIDVISVYGASTPHQEAEKSGRQDMTAQFAKWIVPGAGAYHPAANNQGESGALATPRVAGVAVLSAATGTAAKSRSGGY
jgi:hypothetical protein